LVIDRVAAGAATDLSDRKEQLAKITKTIYAVEKLHPPMITNSMERISSLITAAEPVLNGKRQAERRFLPSEVLTIESGYGVSIKPKSSFFARRTLINLPMRIGPDSHGKS